MSRMPARGVAVKRDSCRHGLEVRGDLGGGGRLTAARSSRILGLFFQATMSLNPGTTLGPYTVTAKIGEGGLPS